MTGLYGIAGIVRGTEGAGVEISVHGDMGVSPAWVSQYSKENPDGQRVSENRLITAGAHGIWLANYYWIQLSKSHVICRATVKLLSGSNVRLAYGRHGNLSRVAGDFQRLGTEGKHNHKLTAG